jgi:O-antigen ligase
MNGSQQGDPVETRTTPKIMTAYSNQGKVFKVAALCGLAGAVLPVILMLAFGNVRGVAVTVFTVVTVALTCVGVVGFRVALGAYKEQGRKPGSLPLIYAVIAFPLGLILIIVGSATHFPPLMLIAMTGIVTSIPALIIGLVKKLSVKTAPA